jgi:hypothetical protein
MKRLVLAIAIVSSVALAAPKKRRPPPHHPPTSPPVEVTPPPPPPTETPPAESAAAPPVETPPPAPPPPPPPPPPKEEPPPKANVDLDALNNEYNQLRDDLFRSRAKARLIGDALFKTKINASFQYKAQRAWPLKKVSLKIDDQPVFTADSPSTNDPLKLYDGFAAPGRHTLALKVDCAGAGEDRVAYGAEGVFIIDVAENKETKIAFVVDESGDGPNKIAKKREGAFDVRVKAEIETVERSK